MTWEMMLNERHEDGFYEGKSEGIAIGEERGIAIGEERGIQQKAIETARNMLANNLSLDLVSSCTGLSVEQIEKL